MIRSKIDDKLNSHKPTCSRSSNNTATSRRVVGVKRWKCSGAPLRTQSVGEWALCPRDSVLIALCRERNRARVLITVVGQESRALFANAFIRKTKPRLFFPGARVQRRSLSANVGLSRIKPVKRTYWGCRPARAYVFDTSPALPRSESPQYSVLDTSLCTRLSVSR